MKWVFASLIVIVVSLVVFGSSRPAGQPLVEIEGRQVPYALVHVEQDGAGDDEVAAWYHDTESDTDFSSRIPHEKGREIVAWQVAHKLGRNYEESLRRRGR